MKKVLSRIQGSYIPKKDVFFNYNESELLCIKYKDNFASKPECFRDLVNRRVETLSIKEIHTEKLEKLINSIKTNLANSDDLSWQFRYFLYASKLFPEEVILEETLVNYKRWENEIEVNLPGIFNKNKRRKISQGHMGVLSPQSEKRIDLKWVAKQFEFSSMHFKMLYNYKKSSFEDFYDTLLVFQEQARVFLTEIDQARKKRKLGNSTLCRLPYGLSGYQIKQYERLYEQSLLLPVYIKEVRDIGKTLEIYKFIVEAKAILFPSKAKRINITDQKISALVDIIPTFQKKKFQKREAFHRDKIKNASERSKTSAQFLFRVIKTELKERNITLGPKVVSLLYETEKKAVVNKSHQPQISKVNQSVSVKEREVNNVDKMMKNRTSESLESVGKLSEGLGRDSSMFSSAYKTNEKEFSDSKPIISVAPSKPTLEVNEKELKSKKIETIAATPSENESNKSSKTTLDSIGNTVHVIPKTKEVVQSTAPEDPSKTKKTGIKRKANTLDDSSTLSVVSSLQDKINMIHRKARRHLLETKLPLRYEHGWVLSLG